MCCSLTRDDIAVQENQFDEMIGVLQDILIDPEFVNMQSDFCLQNCGACLSVSVWSTRGRSRLTHMCLTEVFENVTENKLIYTSIFNEYTNLIGTDPRP